LLRSCADTPGLTLLQFVNKAAMNPITEYKPAELRGLRKGDLRPIMYKDFIVALEKVKPSYGKKEQEFIDWEKSLEK